LGPALLLIVALVPGLACAPRGEVARTPVALGHAPETGDEQTAARQLQAAQRLMRSGENAQAIPRLVQVASDYAGTAAGVAAWYHLGVAYHEIGGYTSAIEYFQQYLELAPEGQHAVSSRDYLRAIAAGEMRVARPQVKETPRIIDARARLEAEPDNLAHQLDLADAYWEATRYRDAARVYEAILPKWPRLEHDMTIRSRMERQADGTFLVLTPEEVSRQLSEAQPLLIINTASFTSGRTTLQSRTAQDIYYNVTGEALNRGSKTLKGVRVYVTIYGLGSTVYDAQSVFVGDLRPGERRPFSVRFTNFANIQNIARYACEGSFDR
jgi:hypothetical protein